MRSRGNKQVHICAYHIPYSLIDIYILLCYIFTSVLRGKNYYSHFAEEKNRESEEYLKSHYTVNTTVGIGC